MQKNPLLNIEVAYASENTYKIIAIQVAPGSSLEAAIVCSGILSDFPEINLAVNLVGIFGKIQSLQETVKENDRIEIYRPLPQSAITARFERVKAQRIMRQRKIKDRG